MAEDVPDFLNEHQLGTVDVLGHSMGGKTAMQFALSFAQRVRSLIVVDMAPRSHEPRHEVILRALRGLDLSRFQHRDEIGRVLATSIPDSSVRRFLLTNVQRRADGHFNWKLNLENLWMNYPALNAAIESRRVFAGPSLFIRGGNSDYVRDADVPEVKRLFPAAQIETIAGAGHWIHSEQPEAFVEIVLRFLATSVGEARQNIFR